MFHWPKWHHLPNPKSTASKGNWNNMIIHPGRTFSSPGSFEYPLKPIKSEFLRVGPTDEHVLRTPQVFLTCGQVEKHCLDSTRFTTWRWARHLQKFLVLLAGKRVDGDGCWVGHQLCLSQPVLVAGLWMCGTQDRKMFVERKVDWRKS